MNTDFIVTNHGSIFLLTPLTEPAYEWVELNLDRDELQTLGRGIAVEHRYIADIAAGIARDGLSIE